MNRTDFGKLIAALRKEQFDPVAGKPWTQQMLAQRTGLLPRTIGEIERGQKAIMDADTLLRLAQAFRLTTLERREFFAAATSVAAADVARDTCDAERIFQELWETMQQLYLPAVLHDAYFDLLAVNTLYRGFHNLPAKLPGDMGGVMRGEMPTSWRSSSVRMHLSAPLRRIVGVRWPRRACTSSAT